MTTATATRTSYKNINSRYCDHFATIPNFGAIAEYPVQIEAGGKGLASTRQVSSVAGSLNEAISYVLATRLCLATHQ